jgi:hypothetical protein
VPEKDFEMCLSPTGRRYYRLDFNVEISAQSSLEFSMTINSKKYASLTASFD